MKNILFRLSFLFLLIIHDFAIGNEQVEPSTYVIITIDHCLTRPGIIYAEIDGVECGVKRLIDICDQYGVIPTFFFSPYDYLIAGEEEVKAVAQYMNKRGCDIQLHTHPRYYYDDGRPDLYQYSLKEQIEIIRHGKEKIEEWTGLTPIAHRAGDYGADINTLKALHVNSIFFDSSRFYKHRSCKLEDLELPINAVGQHEGVVQVPVSAFEFREYSSFFGYKLPALKKIRKIDIDWATYDQIEFSITQLADAGINSITLFMHFHTFFKPAYGKSFENTNLDINDIEKFKKCLDFISRNPKLKIISFKQFIDKYRNREIVVSKNDILPVYKQKISIINYARKVVGVNRKNIRIYAVSSLCLMIITLWSLHYLIYKKGSKGK